MLNLRAISLCLTIFLAFSGMARLEAQKLAPTAQTAAITNLRIKTDLRKSRTLGMGIGFDLDFDLPADSLIPQDNYLGMQYDIQCEILTRFDVPVSSVKDAGNWRDGSGNLAQTKILPLKEKRTHFADRAFFLPYHALNLPPGSEILRIRISIYDRYDHRLLTSTSSELVRINKPEVRLFRIKMREIEVEEKDFEGENWDYYFLAKEQALPDLQWTIHRGEEDVFSSRRRRNAYSMEGSVRDNSGIFSLSAGDEIALRVYDYDLTTASDLIGEKPINPWAEDFSPGIFRHTALGKVKKLIFSIQQYDPPKIIIRNLHLDEEYQHEGITGARIRFDYEYDKAYYDTRFGFEFFQLTDTTGKERHYPEKFQVINGDARVTGPGTVEFYFDNRGHIELFVPHFSLKSDDHDKPLDFAAHGLAELETLEFPNRLRILPFSGPSSFLNDVVVERQSLKQVDLNGSQGLQFDLDYEIPGAYYRDGGGAELFFRPLFSLGNQYFEDKDVELLDPDILKIENGELHIPRDMRKGHLRFFLPFMRTTGQDSLNFSSRLDGFMLNEDAAFLLGRNRFVETVVPPRRDTVSFYVSMAKVKRMLSIGEGPHLGWKVYQGKYLIYSSTTFSGSRKAFWESTESVTLTGPRSDEIRIVIVQRRLAEKDKLLGTYRIPLGRLADRKGRSLKTKPYGIKKIVLVINE